MRSIGNHRLQMGLADCAVQMFTAIDDHDRKGGMWHQHVAKDGTTTYAKVGRPNICTGDEGDGGCGEQVEYGDVAKGYEHEGELVILSKDDLDTIKGNAGDDIEVLRLVAAKEVNPLKFSGEKCYWLLPDEDKKRSGKLTKPVYRAFMQMLVEGDKVAVVSYTKWNKTRTALIRVEPVADGPGVLVLQNMIWPDELRAPDFPVLAKLTDPAVDELANKLLSSMRLVGESITEPWNDDDYRDVYQEQLDAAIEAKAEGKEITEIARGDAAPAPDDVADLIARLEASAKAPAKKAPAKKAPVKKAGKSVA